MAMDTAAVRTRTTSGAGLWPEGSFATEDALALKGTRRVSVVIPARDEAPTVAGVVAPICAAHGPGPGSGLVDEVLVVDDGSTDGTAFAAVRPVRQCIGSDAASARASR